MSLIRNIFANIKNVANDIINPSTEEKQNTIINNQTNGNQSTMINDSLGNIWNLESNGAMPVNIQDQTSELLDIYFGQVQGACTLQTQTVIDSSQVTLVTGHGVSVGDLIVFREGTRYTQCYVNSVSGDIITLDRPIDFEYTTLAQVLRGTSNIAVDGSVTPKIFRVTPAGLNNVKFDITKIIFFIEDDLQMDSKKFGGISSISKGLVLRKKDGIYKNIFSVKNNGDFAHHCESLEYDDRAGLSGLYGLRIVKTFGGQDNQGVVIRLDSSLSDELQIIVQDDLTGLTRLQCVAIGHFLIN